MSDYRKLLVALVLAAALGILASTLAPEAVWLEAFIHYVTEPMGKIFIRLLLLLVLPIVFSALVVGVSGIEIEHLGRLGARTLGYTIAVSVIASVLGVTLVNLLEPGAGLSKAFLASARSSVTASPMPESTSPIDLIVSIVPTNPFQAAASGDMIGFIFFGLFFGIGMALVKTEQAQSLKQVIQGIFDVSMKLIELVLKLAPIGVAALIFSMTARVGPAVLVQLGAYVGVVLLGLGIHLFVVYSLSVRFLGGLSPLRFFSDIKLAAATAFATASSNATLPTALQVADENLKLPRHVSRFVLTAGATMNQNGTALFEGVTVLFLAQAYQIDLSIAQQGLVVAICVFAGIGTAGVPAGSLPVIAMISTMLGIPVEGIGLIVGVDRLLDMCRTTVNVVGDLAAAVFVARGEQEPTDESGSVEIP